MKELIDIAKAINNDGVVGTAIVKSQKRGDPVVNGIAPDGIYYTGQALPSELTMFIADTDADVSMWTAKGTLKAFVTPS